MRPHIALPLLFYSVVAAAQNIASLPLDLRQTVGRYPVTLYAGKDCASCDAGRQLLQARGVPFTEKRVESNDDIAAFRRNTGANSLPVLSIGNQQLKGLNTADWAGYLDAAGYPATSKLPSGWRNPAPTPMATPRSLPPSAAVSPSDDSAPRRNEPAADAPADPTKPNIRF